MPRPLQVSLWIAAGPLILGLLAAVAFRSAGAFLMVPLSAILGPFVGLTSSAPYFTVQFKLGLAAGLLAAAALVFVGVRVFESRWGKPLLLLGSIGWTLAGVLGFGPQ